VPDVRSKVQVHPTGEESRFMRLLRPVTLAVVATALFAATGCRTAGVGNLAPKDPLSSRADESAADLLAAHNYNAERVQSLEAYPSISSSNRRAVGGLSGKLALERPRNFKLVLTAALQDVADIGSNDQEFWFWVKDSPDKAVYYCMYDDSGASPLAMGLQPDWIVEALGLRVISDSEAAGIKVRPGKEPGTVVLTQRQKAPQGEAVIKETVLNEANGRIREHWVYAADHKTPLAHAVINDYKEYPLPAEPGSPPEKVYLPHQLRLEWMLQEKMALDVTMNKVSVNLKMTQQQREARFVEPSIKGLARKNLAERAGVAASGPATTDGPTSVRETLPAPPPRVRLTAPTPLGLDGARRSPREPANFDADLPPAVARGLEAVVDPPIPTIDNPPPETVEVSSSWRGSMAPAIER
jgi:hypothetical protein